MASAEDRSFDGALSVVWSTIARGAAILEASKRRSHAMESMRANLAKMGILEDLSSTKVIHIAGTKGKGSTACMTESILRAHGLRTGLFTSPHLVSLLERFRLNGRPVSEAMFLEHFWRVVDSLGGKEGLPGFFQLLTLVALEMFSAKEVDVLILEVGMGGRLDPTNVVPCPVVCGVTRLDYDHVEVLGGTMRQIGQEVRTLASAAA
jgi:folylpolyglutamate synthase